MERVGKFDARKDRAFNRLYKMSSGDRIRLIDRYAKKTEPVFYDFPEEEVLEIVTKILRIKFSKQALIDSFMAGEAIVDSPGCRLEDYLLSELANQVFCKVNHEYQQSEKRRYYQVRIDNLITDVLFDEDGNEMGQGIGKALNVSQGGILIETKPAAVTSRYIFQVSTYINKNLIENIGKVVFSKECKTVDWYHTGSSFRGDHVDNAKLRKNLIRLYHRSHVLKLKN